MTAERDPDRLVGIFLEDGPAELSPRLLSAIRDDVRSTHQRAPRRPWRTPSMPRALLILVPLAALVLLLGALAFGGGGTRNATPTSAPASPAASAAVVAPSPAAPSMTPGTSPYPIAAGEAWIVFEDGDGFVALVRPDGSERHAVLEADDGNQATPDWSPDGSQLVFERNHAYGSQLWVLNADGTAGSALTDLQETCLGAAACPFTRWPRWSPDGRSVAYVETIVDTDRPVSNSVSVVDVATGEVRKLYASTTDVLRGLSWSPDGAQLVVGVEAYPSLATSQADGMLPTSTTLAVLDATPGAVPVPIPGAPAFAGHPDWSRDGSLIVFRTNPFVNGVLADPEAPTTIGTIAPAGGAVTTVLTSDPGERILRGTSWTPDGSGILYSALLRASSTPTIRIVDADGSNDRPAAGLQTTRGGEPRLRPTP